MFDLLSGYEYPDRDVALNSQTRSTALIGLYHSALAAVTFVCIVVFERRRRRAEDPIEVRGTRVGGRGSVGV